jgi:hypothetical protein
MTEIRNGPAKHARILVLQAPAVAIGIGAVVAALGGWIGVTAGLALFGAALAASIAIAAWQMRTFKCPQCGQGLLQPRGWWYRYPGAPILMRCVPCDIDWDFGLRGQRD